ncbi:MULTISPECIES: acyl-CoA dehydrogenase family protein [Mycolicibacterium]|uniref:Acyl-CoA dehydrogenase family protein n=1 Tax=Mycolicibacterium austroafricanum TaxID=39687 RepID=A0ABT8HJ21_MYCAO|nr:acyl-CoA dehydrogenase family protein [Mycolicibacterium austroafricanum]MDN4520777.1 acyl-CoA dehydrogenase family protein [Mycolicibacterium austroafricanum]PQP49815.1 acyl-CoA dehydrogenase [Mycolicibacterium austroafricanum]
MTDVHADPGMAVDADLLQMMDAVLADYRQGHPPAPAVRFDAELWESLHQLGLVRLTGAPGSGGSGAGWAESAALISSATRHAVRVPLAEHDLLACWLLEAAGLPVDDAVRTVCVLDEAGTATAVPWAAYAGRVVAIWSDGDSHRVADIDRGSLHIAPGTNMIGEPRDTVTADISALAPHSTAIDADLVEQLRLKCALVRAIQVCSALDTILVLAVEHTTSRVQFGRSLSKFQAVQHMIADMAGEAALASASTEAALAAAIASGWAADNLGFLVAVARSCTGHAASVVVRNAHQALGAIGTTIEHRLHEYTRAALTWRSEYGSVQHWDEVVTRNALDAGTRGLWGLITG